MASNFIVAIGAVLPMFLQMLVGVYVKKARLLNEVELNHVNRMAFRVFFFFMMFYNIYTTNIETAFRPGLMLFGGLGLLGVVLVATLFTCTIEKDNRRRGAMIQAMFRSNFVFMGIPLIMNTFGDDMIAIPTMMIAIIVPLYNIISVIILETFRGGSFNVAHIILGVFKNPMIQGALLGAILLIAGVKIPAPFLKPIQQIAAATTPLALIILGASFKAGTFHHHLRQLVIAVSAKLIVVPAVMIGLAVFLGFRGIELVTILGIFATPCAVAGFAMAQQMNSDAELAGNCIVYTSAFSCITMFAWMLALKTLGLF